MRKILITGITGLIGSHIVEPLAEDSYVYGISRRSIDDKSVPGNTRQITVDLAEDWGMGLLPGQIDAVIHLAQSEHFRDFPAFSEEIFRVNTLSAVRLLDYARRAGASTFILASSGGVYGFGENEFSEESEIVSKGDLGFYLGAKLCSEVLAENYTPYMNVIILRFFFVYGPGQRRTMLIPRLVQSVMEGKEIILQGGDGIRTNPIYVTDAVRAITRTLELDGSHKINVGGPGVLSLREIGEIIGAGMNKEPRFCLQPEVKPRHLVGDIRKMTRLLGAPSIPFSEGVKSIIREIR
jgi:UDP-glucose 4-epimerase